MSDRRKRKMKLHEIINKIRFVTKIRIPADDPCDTSVVFVRDNILNKTGLTLGQTKMDLSQDIMSSKNIITSVIPDGINGFSMEEYNFTNCYKAIFQLAMEYDVKSLAIPVCETEICSLPSKRCIEIVLNCIIQEEEIFDHISQIVLYCTSTGYEAVKDVLKEMYLDTALHEAIPEYDDFVFETIFSLAKLEWGNPGAYNDFAKNFTKNEIVLRYKGAIKEKTSIYALSMRYWDYNTCLAYIIFLQRNDYWSGGLENTLYDQYRNGTILRVVKRMRMLYILEQAMEDFSVVEDRKAEDIKPKEIKEDNHETEAALKEATPEENSNFSILKKFLRKWHGKKEESQPEISEVKANDTTENVEKVSGTKACTLDYIKSFARIKSTGKVGECRAYHDISMKRWRLYTQLDENRYYFFSAFVGEDGVFEKYCLDYEAASDSHYEFEEESGIRAKLYVEGDEDLYLHEILTRYVMENGTGNLLNLIQPYVTKAFHFD